MENVDVDNHRRTQLKKSLVNVLVLQELTGVKQLTGANVHIFILAID